MKLSGLFCGIQAIAISALLTAASAGAETPMVVQGQYLVRSKPELTSGSVPRAFRIFNATSEKRRPKRFHRFRSLCPEILRANPSLESCYPNFIIRAAGDPYISQCSDPLSCNWGADNTFDTDVDLPAAWQITEGNPDIAVAVLDTGVDLVHPDLAQNVWINPGEIPGNGLDDDGNGYIDDVNGLNAFGPGAPQDDNGHGTHVAGIIAAVKDNGIGIAGVAPRVKIIPVKILDAQGQGNVAVAVKGIEYVAALAELGIVNVVVYNNSWGGVLPAGEAEPLRQAFKRAEQAGLLAVNAAGNERTNIDGARYYPARFDLEGSINVASTDISGRLSSFSNFGPATVHLAAPGGEIRSLLLNGSLFGKSREDGTTVASGTSMSVPFVSGAAALIKSAAPDLSSPEIKDRLLHRAYSLPDEDRGKVISGGRLNMFYALSDGEIPVPTALSTPEPTHTPQPTATATATPVPSLTPASVPVETPDIFFDLSGFRVAAAPVQKFGVIPEGSSGYLFARGLNVITAEIPERLVSAGVSLRLKYGSCPLGEVSLSAKRTYLSLSFGKKLKAAKSVTFETDSGEGRILSTQTLAVRKRKKGKVPKNCARIVKKLKFKVL